jgi:FHS family L-fucose permease-like MFS transporter
VAVGATFILSDAGTSVADQAATVRIPYLVIAGVTLLWAALILATRFPAVAIQRADPQDGTAVAAPFRALLGRPRYLAGIASQFFYVGAQVGIWSFLIRYTAVALPTFGTRHAAYMLTGSLVLFMAGRFLGSALMSRISSARLMLVFALIDAALCLVSVAHGGWVGVSALVLSSAFMSIMYPTIFVLTLRGLGPLTKPGASMIVMAIVGGAVLTALMGLLSDLTGTIRAAMLVPAFCFLIVAAFARMHVRDVEEAPA